MVAATQESTPEPSSPKSRELRVVKASELSQKKTSTGSAVDTSLKDDNGTVTGKNQSDVAGKATKPVSDNIVLNSVRELSTLYTSMEELRGELRARGVQGQATNVMVEMAFHNRQTEMQGLIEAALQSSRQAYGHGAITRQELQDTLDNLLAIEKDVAYTRKLCKQRGLDLQVINLLTQLVRQNPGDGGQKAINTFLGYAVACKIELSGIDQITQKYTTEPASVLPDIQRPVEDAQRLFRNTLVRDVLIGIIFTVALMALLA